MSLRTRLLIAIGVIALLALAIADVVTYSALESFLYQRIDQQLEASHIGIERTVNRGQLLSCYPFPGRAGRGPFGAGNGGLGSPGPGSNQVHRPTPSRCWRWRCENSRVAWSNHRPARPTWTAPTTPRWSPTR